MRSHIRPRASWLRAACLAALSALGTPADSLADVVTRHGIAMYGEPELPPGFPHLPHVNPDAPKGGRIVFGEPGGFDSLNPFILKGRAPWPVANFTVETLMARSWDEPFTLYGLLAESVTTDSARTFVEFTLREGARFSDGAPVTVADVIASHDLLGRLGSPRYFAAHAAVAAVRQTGPRSVRFDFRAPDRELPLLLALRPVLKAAEWTSRDFGASSLAPITGSGPYVVAAVDPGRSLTLRRNPDWWARDLPVMRGQHNIDELRFEYFADGQAMFEAFKAGLLTVFREANVTRWTGGYDFPALRDGRVRMAEIPMGAPSGLFGFAFNTRRPPLDDWRVRAALIDSFNFPFVNATLNAGAEPRIRSVFSNSALGMPPGPADARTRALLAPFAATLPPDALDDLALPPGDPGEANRAGLRSATRRMADAGWTNADGTMRDAAGRALALEMLLPQGAAELRAAATLWAAALDRLGIALRITAVDDAQYAARTAEYDFDITPMRRAMSLSPGTEQRLYWSRRGVTEPGTRNWPGVDSPAVEAMIDRLFAAETPDDHAAAARALDRALMAGRYVVPLWFSDRARIAHDARLHWPARLSLYGAWSGFLPEVWWWAD
ncbi:MAG: extracellular solute-binding protein [Gemmobacter sp.]